MKGTFRWHVGNRLYLPEKECKTVKKIGRVISFIWTWQRQRKQLIGIDPCTFGSKIWSSNNKHNLNTNKSEVRFNTGVSNGWYIDRSLMSPCEQHTSHNFGTCGGVVLIEQYSRITWQYSYFKGSKLKDYTRFFQISHIVKNRKPLDRFWSFVSRIIYVFTKSLWTVPFNFIPGSNIYPSFIRRP